jgi:hypothetical protein
LLLLLHMQPGMFLMITSIVKPTACSPINLLFVPVLVMELQVNDALREQMASIHALSIKKAMTPAQLEAQRQQQQQQ